MWDQCVVPPTLFRCLRGCTVWGIHVHYLGESNLRERLNVGEVFNRHIRERVLHELQPDRQSGPRSGLTAPERFLFVVKSDPNPGGKLRRESQVPGIGEIVCGSCFAGRWAAKRPGTDSSAKINHIFEHGDHGARNFR